MNIITVYYPGNDFILIDDRDKETPSLTPEQSERYVCVCIFLSSLCTLSIIMIIQIPNLTIILFWGDSYMYVQYY